MVTFMGIASIVAFVLAIMTVYRFFTGGNWKSTGIATVICTIAFCCGLFGTFLYQTSNMTPEQLREMERIGKRREEQEKAEEEARKKSAEETQAKQKAEQEARKKAAAEAEAKRKADEEASNRSDFETATEHGINSMVFWFTAVNQPKAHQFGSLRQKLPFQGSPTPQELKETKYIYAKEDLKLFGKNPLVITSGRSDKGFLYYGETKDNKPHGVGMLAKFDIDYPYPIYIGNFRDGLYDGYGILYERPTTPPPGREYMSMSFVKYEGEFENGVFSGKGNKYYLSNFTQMQGYPNVYVPAIQLSSGTYDDGEMDGKFYQYLMDELIFEGNYKDGKKNGDGIEYYPDGTIRYKGEFKNGKWDGEGTLYAEDGSVKYSGKWKNGDYAH